MIIDALCKFSDAQAATTNTTTYSDYTYDCGNVTPKREIGTGEPLCVVITVAAVTGSADTIEIAVISTTSATSPATNALELCSRLIPAATLAVGTRHVLSIPPGSVTQRYLAVRYTLGSGDALTCDADLVPQSLVGMFTQYADNVTWS